MLCTARNGFPGAMTFDQLRFCSSVSFEKMAFGQGIKLNETDPSIQI
jgi:hypothetical protein